MTRFFASRPIPDTKLRLDIIRAASGYLLRCTFVLSFFVTAIIHAIESFHYQKLSQIEDLLLAPFYWLFSLIFILPALVIAWPLANITLRFGYAGWATAVCACSLLLTLALTIGLAPIFSLQIIALGVGSGFGFGTAYWLGAYRKFPSTFETSLPESD